MNILLTGATGFLGSRTLEVLIQNPSIHKIVGTGRQLKSHNKIDHPKLEYKLGDLSNSGFVEEITKNIDCIINAAALSKPWGKYKEFYESNVVSQQNLIRAAKRNNVSRFVYISTPGIYYNGKNRLNVKESDELPKKFINAYATTKRFAEIELASSGLDYISLRPRALIGRGDTVIMPRLIRAYREGRLKIVGSGTNLVDLTAVANVASAVELSLFAKGESLNQTYNITNGNPVMLWIYIEQVLGLLGYKFDGKRVPYFIARLAAEIMELKSKLSDYSEPVLTVYSIGTLAHSLTLDISKARHLLGYEPEVSVQEALSEFVGWYKNVYEKG